MTQIKDNYACGSSGVTSRETAMLLGMGRAYDKLKARIKREGLFSLVLQATPYQDLSTVLSLLIETRKQRFCCFFRLIFSLSTILTSTQKGVRMTLNVKIIQGGINYVTINKH